MKKSRFTDSQIIAVHEVGDGRLAPLLATARSGGITVGLGRYPSAEDRIA